MRNKHRLFVEKEKSEVTEASVSQDQEEDFKKGKGGCYRLIGGKHVRIDSLEQSESENGGE